MSTRSSLRLKVVLPVSVYRAGEKKFVAHTMDVAADSVRIGGLFSSLTPGESVEIQRLGSRARFQVIWVGTPKSPMEGQAGLKSLCSSKNIWGNDLALGDSDRPVEFTALRSHYPLVITGPVDEQRWHQRFRCEGSATLSARGSNYPVYMRIQDISRSGVYLQSTTVFPVNAKVQLSMNVEGVAFDMPGIIRTVDPLVGIGVGFQRGSEFNETKLLYAIETLKRKAAAAAQQALTSLVRIPAAI